MYNIFSFFFCKKHVDLLKISIHKKTAVDDRII